MRILFLDTKPIRRGAQVFLSDLSAYARQKGHTVCKVYLYAYNEGPTVDLTDNDKVLGGNEQHIFEKIPTIHPLLLRKLIKTIRSFKPDIILLNGSKTLKYAATAARVLPEKPLMVYRIIDSVRFWNRNRLKQWYYRYWVMKPLHAAVGVSHASLEDVQRLYSFNKPVTVVHRSVNFNNLADAPTRQQSRNTFGVTDESPVLLFLGNLTQQKRPDRFVTLIHQLKTQYPSIKGWMVGDGPLRQEVEKQIMECGLQQQITCWGYQRKVGPYIAGSDLLLLTSDTEGLPGVVVEAGYLSVPSVANNVGGIKECLVDGETGFITHCREADCFMEPVMTLLNDPHRRKEMGIAARKKAIQQFDIQVGGEKFLHFFETLIQQHAR